MGFTEYYDARNIITEIISKDLLGPVEENEVICGDRPLDYYILGKLYPIDTQADILLGMSSEDCGDLDEENTISLCKGKNPSSFGVSVAIKKEKNFFCVRGRAARYEKKDFSEIKEELALEETEKNLKQDYWKREVLPYIEENVNVDELEIGKALKILVTDGLEIRVLLHRIMKDGARIVTVTMTNTNQSNGDFRQESAYSFFQPEIEIYENEPNTLAELAYKIGMTTDEEIIELNMLYHEVKNYASGHGCAVEVNEVDGLKHVYSRFLPEYEVKQMKPSTNFSGKIL